MNILIISFEFPPDPGGMGEYAFQAANNLSRNHKVTALVAFNKLPLKNYENFILNQNFTIEWLKGYNGKTSFLIRKIIKIRKICVQDNINLILVVSPNAGIISYIFNKIYNIPYFMVGHGSEFLPANPRRDFLIKLYYNNCNLILANSNFTIGLISKYSINNKNITLLFPGGDDTLFDLSLYPKRVYSSKIILLSVGALSVRKGHKYVIEAVNELKNDFPDLEYWIIGQGSEKQKLKEYIKEKKLKDIVKLIGFVKRTELPEYYAKANLLILNSNSKDKTQVEGFGIVLIEAHLMKLPVIGAINSGMVDAIIEGENGELVDSEDISDIRKVIKSFLKDPHKMKLYGENGYMRAKQEFTWKVFGEKLNSIIANMNEK